MFASIGSKVLKLLMQKMIGNKIGTNYSYPIYDRWSVLSHLQVLDNFLHNSCVYLFLLIIGDISAYTFLWSNIFWYCILLFYKANSNNKIIIHKHNNLNQLLFLNEVKTMIQTTVLQLLYVMISNTYSSNFLFLHVTYIKFIE
jgi:hypothetical protein